MMMDLDQLLQRQSLAIKLARKAGQLIKETTGAITTIDNKCSFADLVTETDRTCEKMVFEEIKQHFPDDDFIGEESSSDNTSLTDRGTWIIDPVDGTTNFVHSFPFSCISIGFALDRQSVIGVVYNPHFDLLYTAIKGQGAKVISNEGALEQKLSVRSCPSLSQALIVSELGSQRTEAKRECVFKNMETIGWQCHGIRMLGSCALNLCSVAAGQTDAFFEYGPYSWDVCAGSIIVTEAGGYLCDTDGSEFNLEARRFIAASSEKLAKEISSKIVVQYDPKTEQ
ncbi:adapter molecule Crk-like [Sarcoptes scabiei]|nr:adapter molecule Crk-like [Sarcoptes scabiei]